MEKKVIKVSIGSLIVIFILVAILGVVYFKTDLLKPSGELFQKYFKESIQNIDSALEFANEQQYINIFDEKDYNEDTQAVLKYKNSQGNEETFKIAIIGDTSNQTKNSYRDINIKNEEDTEILNLSFLNEQNTYGILLSDIAEKYISADTTKLDAICNTFNIDKNKVSDYITKYNPKEVLNAIMNSKKDVINAVTNVVSKANKKQYKNVIEQVITLSNGESVTAKKYQLTLTKNQTQTIMQDVLEKMGAQEKIKEIEENNIEFYEAIIDIYVLENSTARLNIAYNDINTVVDFYENEINIKYTSSKIPEADIDIKNDNENKIIEYSDKSQNSIKLSENIVNGEDINKLNATISIKNPNIQELEIEIQQKLEIKDNLQINRSFEILDNDNLSDLDNNKMNTLVGSLLEKINSKLEASQGTKNYEIITTLIQYNKNIEERCKSLIEKDNSDFNNQFLMYQGENVGKDIVYNMMDVVEKNLLKYQVSGEDKTRVIIEQGKENKELAEEIKTRIKNAKNYFKIEFEYDDEGKINAILILENTKQ